MSEQALIAVLSLIFAPLLLYTARTWWERRRWKRFADSITRFAESEVIDHRMEMADLQALVAIKMDDAGYEPAHIKQLLSVATIFAAGRISYQREGKYLGNLSPTPPSTEPSDDDHDSHS